MAERGNCAVEVVDVGEGVKVCRLDAGLVGLLDMPVDLALVDLDLLHPVIALGALLAVLAALDHRLLQLIGEAAVDLELLHGGALGFARVRGYSQVTHFMKLGIVLRLLVVRGRVELLDRPFLHQAALVGRA